MNGFDQAFARLVGNEGGYSNNAADPGGETMWGITLNVARAHGYAGTMKMLPLETAKQIARESYWESCKADLYDPAIGFQVFDAAYNHGTDTAIRFLQRAAGVADDGQIGPVTLDAIKAASVTDVVARFNAERLDFYTKLSTWPTFGKGWARRIVSNLRYASEDI